MKFKEKHPKIHKLGSWAWYKYHYAVWHVQKFEEEAGKPLIFVDKFGIILVLMGQRGYIPSWLEIIGIYLLVGGLAFTFGVIFIKLGALRIKTTLANKEDPLKNEILERIKNIENKLNES